MGVLGVLLSVAKMAVGTVIQNQKFEMVPPVFTDIKGKIKQKRKGTALELKVHEIVTVVAQLVMTVFQLFKLVRAFIPNSLWKTPNR